MVIKYIYIDFWKKAISLLAFTALLFSACTRQEFGEELEEVNDVPFQVAQLSIVTEGEQEISSKETYVNCAITLDSDRNEWNYSGTGKIRGRGNSTWHWYPKKPYRIRLDEKAEWLGLKADKDWVLLADYRDPTHLMNTFVFNIGQALEIPYTNHTRYVEVRLNGEYIGLYHLTEQVEQGTNRVAINPTSGILLSLDADDGPEHSPYASDNFWSSGYNMPVCVKNPDIENQNQLLAIKEELAQLEETIKKADYSEVEKLFDIPVFIDFMIIQELIYNVEVAAPRSMYIYKDVAGLWTMGPLWDFDAGYDFDWSTMYTGHNYFKSYRELVLGTSPKDHVGGYWVPDFFTDLFKSKKFVRQYKARWLEIKEDITTDYWSTTKAYADSFSEAMIRDAERWPINKNHSIEVENMQLWLSNRVGYLSIVIENYPEGTK